ncbi:MAG: HAMP domain-containing sensor histidine kinase [Gemmatimonadales bacterium]
MPTDKGGMIAEHSSLTHLRLAADRVLRASVVGSPDTADVTELIEFILAEAGTDSPGSSTHPSLRTPQCRMLLHSMRRDVLSQWTPGGGEKETEEILRTLVVLERLLTAANEDSDRETGDRWLGSDGLDLVVQVAHDLRSPLTSILFLAETLQRGQSGDVNELQHRQLGLIYSAALGLSTVTSNVIELARGGSRLSDDEPSPFSVSDILESVHDIVRPMAEEKGLIIRLLRPVSDHRLGHPHALSRVLLNLTTNGLKFTEEGFVEIVAKESSLTEMEFSVRDTGPGINAKTLETLYQPFRRSGDGRGYDFSGTGLGLALSRRLVTAMGSELKVETRPGWGTRFYFTLELRVPEHS